MALKKNFDLAKGFQKARSAVKGEVKDIALEARSEMLRVIDLRDAKATGDLEASIQAHVESRAGGVRMVAGADAKPGSNVAPYAHWVDQPTRPHWVPIQPLKRWARAKFGATGREKSEIAYGAQWSIKRRGTSGVRFVDAGWREIKDSLAERIEDVVAENILD